MLQDLRDRKEVVFILATNRVESIDTAITRLGRFDIVRCVLPPSPEERKGMLDKLVRNYQLSEEVQKYIADLQVAEDGDRFCFGDLDAFVREIAISVTSGECTRDTVKRVLRHAQERAIAKDKLEPYIKSMEKFDRPIPDLKDKLKYWDYLQVLDVHESLETANDAINSLGLVPQGF
jgi:SpoVK/Ycf46/Vps4 family AAA+-type ATPase